MKKPLPHFSFPSAFTLVELIVVIAVLAVLAAISFSTVANITSGARDSARLTDISSMKTSLETYNATKWGFPMPDNAVAISWSGNLAWSQGTFGDNTARALNTISRPKDPKWGVDYSYSITNSKKEYEIATVLEKATSFNGVEKTYAQGEQYDTMIKGNYNGVAIKVSSAISTWILSVPTIIASDIKDAKLENIVFAYPKSGNEPFSYTGVVSSPQAVPTGWTVKQVWSGALILPKTDSELQQLTTDLKTAYTGSPAANNEVIKSLLATSDGKTYGANVVNNVGGNIVISGGNGCSKICGATSGVASTFATGGGLGITIDDAENLYVVNSTISVIFKINSAGIVSNFVTNGLANPRGIAISNTGDLYIANTDGLNSISKVSPTGVVTSFVSNVWLSGPYGLVLDTMKNLYVVNNSNDTISKINPLWVMTTFASGGWLSGPIGITIDATENLYVTNWNSNTISKISPTGVVTTFASGGWLSRPAGITIDRSGNLYVANYSASTISKISPTGVITTFVNTWVDLPYGIVISNNSEKLYVSNVLNNAVFKITPQ